jgi:hypothetical protein
MVKNGRTDYRLKGDPWRVNVHDFEDKKLGKVVPYGPAVLSTDQRIFSGFVTSRRNPMVAPPRPAPAPCDLWPICHSNLKHNYPLNQGESRRREGAPVMDRREPRAGFILYAIEPTMHSHAFGGCLLILWRSHGRGGIGLTLIWGRPFCWGLQKRGHCPKYRR